MIKKTGNYTVDVMIPTYKPDERFKGLLLKLRQQSYPVRHIFVVNTEREYWDRAAEAEIPELRVTHIKRGDFDHGGTRRRMAARSDADLLLFMTQDAVPADNFLVEELVNTFAVPSVKAAYARQLPAENCGLLERFTRKFNYPPEADIKDKSDLPQMGIKTFFCSNVCAMYERRTYEELGGFAERTIFNEDMIFGGTLIRSGYAIAYAADAKVIHSHNYNCMQQLRRNFDLGVSQAEHPEIFEGVPSEGEGVRLVKKSAAYVMRIGRPWLLWKLFWQSAFKYAGYFLGKHYGSLPRGIVRACTMNRDYWEKTDGR